jgi:hypothetical protein
MILIEHFYMIELQRCFKNQVHQEYVLKQMQINYINYDFLVQKQ